MPPTKPTVYVVDDDPAVCDSLQCLLEAGGLRVKTYLSAEAFLKEAQIDAPGCLVLDVRMRDMSGLELQAKLAQEKSSLPIIILTGHGDIPMAVRAMRDGAVDFLEKPVSDEVLLARLRRALELDASRRMERRRRADTAARLQSLTPRERQVMELVLAGKANKLIATELKIAEKTVEVHRKRVLHKMGVHGAVRLAQVLSGLQR